MTEDHLLNFTDGWLSEYVSVAYNKSDSPVAYQIAGGLVVLSTVIGESARISLYNDYYPPTVWMLIVGRSGESRKSVPLKMAQRVLGHLDHKYLMSQTVTGPRRMSKLQEWPSQCQIIPELNRWMQQMRKEYHLGDLGDLIELYDSPPWKDTSTIARQDETVDMPNQTLFVASTPIDVEENATRQLRLGGFLGRWQWWYVRKKERHYEHDAPGMTQVELDELCNGLKKIRDSAKGEVDLSRAAGQKKIELAELKLLDWPDWLHGVEPRVETSLVRIATLVSASSHGSLDINDQDIHRAAELIRFCNSSLWELTSDIYVTGSSEKREVLRIIEEHPSVRTDELCRRSGLLWGRLLLVLDTLRKEKSAECKPSKLDITEEVQWTLPVA